MKRSRLLEIIREVLSESGAMENVTANTGGGAGNPQVPNMIAKPGQGENSATKFTKKAFGFTTVQEKQRQYSTEMVDYINEEDAGNAEAPYAFTTEEDLHTHAGVKISEKLGMQIVDKKKKSTVNKVKTSQQTNNKNKK